MYLILLYVGLQLLDAAHQQLEGFAAIVVRVRFVGQLLLQCHDRAVAVGELLTQRKSDVAQQLRGSGGRRVVVLCGW